MNGALLPLPNTPSSRGDQLKKAQGQLYLYLTPSSHLKSDLIVLRVSFHLDSFAVGRSCLIVILVIFMGR